MIYLIILAIIGLSFWAGYLYGWVRHTEMTIKELRKIMPIQDEPAIEDIPGYEEHKEKKFQAHCKKCGDEILGDEDSLCGRCV